MILVTAMIFISSQLSGLLAFIQLFSSDDDDNSGDDDDSRRRMLTTTTSAAFAWLHGERL
tara:strand:- start:636 stop:815 length:180 start_codon:yes stop_codon:yes gene_type:complete